MARTSNSIIRVPFTGTVRLKAILLKAGPAGHTPASISLVRHKVANWHLRANVNFCLVPKRADTGFRRYPGAQTHAGDRRTSEQRYRRILCQVIASMCI